MLWRVVGANVVAHVPPMLSNWLLCLQWKGISSIVSMLSSPKP